MSNEVAQQTRESIVAAMVDQSSLRGLESVSIGGLAESLGMSKAGVVGPFGSKEALQVAAVEKAAVIFRREVWERAEKKPPGLERLKAIAEEWNSYLERDVFPGGCFMTAASSEFDGRDGPVRKAIDDSLALWQRALAAEVRAAVEAKELPGDTDPEQIAFEVGAIATGVNQARQLRRDAEAGVRGRRAMRRVLGC